MVMQEGGKAVNSLIDSLKSQPLSLALVVMNVALLVLLWYVAVTSAQFRKDELAMVFQQQKEVQQLLANCVVPK